MPKRKGRVLGWLAILNPGARQFQPRDGKLLELTNFFHRFGNNPESALVSILSAAVFRFRSGISKFPRQIVTAPYIWGINIRRRDNYYYSNH